MPAPLTLTVTVPPPPAAPRHYLLTHLVVSDGAGDRVRLYPHGDAAAGWQAAARDYFDRLTAGQPARVRCICWWCETSLDDCERGRERLASTLRMESAEWGGWEPEECIGERLLPRRNDRHVVHRTARGGSN